jgi:hypothetical protein
LNYLVKKMNKVKEISYLFIGNKKKIE